MSTSRSGPVLVARSPSLEHQFASMSLSGAASSSSASAPQSPALSPKVLACFEEQRKIGAQWPKNPYPMKYDISVYRLADGTGNDKCLASVDSRDWRQRELSIRITDAAIDILDEVLRKPIAEESMKNWRGITAQNKDNFFINVSLHTSDLPDFPRAKAADTRSQQAQFPINPTSKGIVLAVTKEKLQQIGLKVLSYGALGPEHNPGPVLYEEIERRIFALFSKMFRPEYVCMNWLANRPQKLSVKKFNGKDKIFDIGSPSYGLACEVARRLIRQFGMNRQIVHSLLEGYIRDSRIPKDQAETMAEIIRDGLTEERMGILSM